MAGFGDYQNEIYIAGLHGHQPRLPIRFEEMQAKAHAALPASLVSYVAGGCGNERTQDANVAAFDGWGLVPRMFVGATQRELSIDLFGLKLPTPLFMSPIGVIGLCAQDGHGDLATARAAAQTGVPMIASTLSVDTLEDVAGALGPTPGFFQLYTPTDRELAESLVHRAEAAGFKAIVVTLDTWLTGWRPRDLSLANFPQLRGLLPRELLFRPTISRPARQAARAGSAERHVPMGASLRQSADLERPAMAAVVDQAAFAGQGHLSSRRCAARHRWRC